jgi:hypothetical protein
VYRRQAQITGRDGVATIFFQRGEKSEDDFGVEFCDC